jgi:hydrogenase maturation protease
MTKTPLVLGIGNLLMGDEGLGVHAVRALEQAPPIPGVAVVDGGTGGFHLLEYLSTYDPVVLIDATMDGRPPGTVSVLAPRYASDFPRSLTAHDIGLRDLIEAAVLTGPLPQLWLVTVSIAGMQPMQTEMSAEIASAIPRVIEAVRRLLPADRPGSHEAVPSAPPPVLP